MRNKSVFCFGLFLALLFFILPAAAEEVRLSAAASLTEAVKELVTKYRQQDPAVQLLPNFASSGALAKQISAGAPADIYISANPKWMVYLQQQGFVAEASKQVLVHNQLVFVGPPDSPVRSLPQLPLLQRIALCSPKSSPAGKYAEQALVAAALYPQLIAEQKLILAKDVRQALLYADRGEVDGAFVYQTDARLASRAKILFQVPKTLYPQVIYPATLTRVGAEKSAAQKFFKFLFSAEARSVFSHYGFQLP